MTDLHSLTHPQNSFDAEQSREKRNSNNCTNEVKYRRWDHPAKESHHGEILSSKKYIHFVWVFYFHLSSLQRWFPLRMIWGKSPGVWACRQAGPPCQSSEHPGRVGGPSWGCRGWRLWGRCRDGGRASESALASSSRQNSWGWRRAQRRRGSSSSLQGEIFCNEVEKIIDKIGVSSWKWLSRNYV